MNDIINKTELLEEIDGDWEFLEESVEILMEDAPTLLTEIKNGLAANDAEAIWQNAHALKSMVGNFFAKRSFEAAHRVETLGRNGDISEVDMEILILEIEIQQLISALSNFLKNK